MIVHLCCIAKNEELYIEDWMIHYFNLGIDFIYIYDNNDDKSTLLKLLSHSNKLKKYKKKFLRIPFINKQNDAYRDCYKRFSDNFDWLLICDIDEFIDLNDCSNAFFKKLRNEEVLESDYQKYANIKQLLENYKDSQILSLKCVEYGDNDLIERDMTKSAYEIFDKKAFRQTSRISKTFFNKHLIEKFDTRCGHYLIEHRVKKFNFINQNEKVINNYKHKLLENEPFIRHIRSYSLKEYLDQKYRVKHQLEIKDIRRYLLSLYYFKLNKWTIEKQSYIDEYKKNHNIIRTLYMMNEETYEKYKNIFNDQYVYIYNQDDEFISSTKIDLIFKGIKALKMIIYDFDNIVFI